MGRVADTPEACAVTLRGVNRLERWSDSNLSKFNSENGKILYWVRNNPTPIFYLIGPSISSFAEKDPRVLVNIKLNMNKECALAAKKN